jgi:aryl-phospho-beta-D-glucosidase BglC (GH1 family)
LEPRTVPSNSPGLSADPFLQANGITIRNGHGTGSPVLLQGTNLGGWLISENWMAPRDSSGNLPDDYSERQTLISRFGTAQANSLIATYQQSWITTQDLVNIKGLGMNIVRVPFYWLDLVNMDGSWRSDAYTELDWVVNTCSALGIYVLLDFHGVPGTVTVNNQVNGQVSPVAAYWSSTTDQQLTLSIWQAIATRYASNPWVAGYDLLNEPSGAPSKAALWDAYNSLYAGIRSVDPNHMIWMEATWGDWLLDALPDPASEGWTNVVYQVHEYQFSSSGNVSAVEAGTNTRVQDYKNHLSWNVPYIVGEFNDFAPGLTPASVWDYTIQQYQQNNIGWISWSYRYDQSGTSSWGIYDAITPQPAIPNLQTASAATIQNDWAQWTTAKSSQVTAWLQSAVDVNVRGQFSDADIGSPGMLGGSAYDPLNGQWTVLGGGSDIMGPSDQFNYSSQPVTGDQTMVVQITAVPNTDPWAKAGLMFRAGTGADAAYAFVFLSAGNGVGFEYRSATGGTAAGGGYASSVTGPVWVKLARAGSNFTAYYSADGVTWTQLGGAQTIAMSGTAQAGLAVTAHNNSSLNASTFKSFGLLPSDWSDADVGGPAFPGGAAFDGQTWTVTGSGSDVYNTSDQMNFAAQPFTGDGAFTVQVTSQETTDPWAKSGVMLRASSSAGAAYAGVFITPGNGVAFQWRNANGGSTSNIGVSGLTAPIWLRLVRAGNSYSAYYSTSGGTWTQVGATQTFTLPATAQAGLAVTAHNGTQLNTSTFTGVSFLPPGWTDADLGALAATGNASFDTTTATWTVSGGGAGPGGTSDQLNYVSQSAGGSLTLAAEVASIGNISPGASAGVMIRAGSDPAAAFAAVLDTSSNGLVFQWRPSAGATTSSVVVAGPNAPVWVRLVLLGNSASAFYSTDDITWTQVGGSQAVAMPSTFLAGLAVSAASSAGVNTATFKQLSLLPADWTDADVGSPGLPGSASLSAPTWTIAASGAGITGTSDQLHFAAEPFTGTLTLSARVTGLQNTGAGSEAGVMVRASASPGAAYFAVLVTPTSGLEMQWRSSPGGPTSTTVQTGLSAPVWVRLVHTGNSFSAFYSSNGTSWIHFGSSPTVVLSSPALAGLAVTSGSTTALNTATFTGVSFLPTGWTDIDLGSPGQTGGAIYDPSAAVWNVTGGGSDIGGASDQFHLASTTLAGDGTVVAQVLTQQAADPGAKAGILLRASATANAAYAGVFVTPGNGVMFQWRSASGGATSSVSVAGFAAPLWVKLSRVGNSVGGYYSSDGIAWTQIGTSQPISLSTSAVAGLGVTAHNNVLASTATFSNVAITPAPATMLTFSAPPSASAGTAFTFTVTALDSAGNLAAAYAGTIQFSSSDPSLTFVNAATGLPLTGNHYTFTQSDAGQHTFQATETAAGSLTLTAQATGLTTGSATLSLSPGPLNKYQVAPGGTSAAAGSAFLVSVQAVDAYGNPITSYGGPATLTAGVSPSSSASNFPVTVNMNSSGLGLFLANLQKVGTYTISVAGGGFTGTASPVTVSPGPAAALAFTGPPTGEPTGIVLPPVSVQLVDLYGNVITTDNTDVVTLGVASGPGPFTVGSTTTAPVHNGSATFNNLTLIVPGSYSLSAQVASQYTGPNSAPFAMAPLQVLPGSFAGTPSGFSLQFNAPFLINSMTPVLYGQGFGASAPAPSVIVTTDPGHLNNTAAYVEGSLVLNPATNALTFVATDTALYSNTGSPLLPDGTYTVIVRSGAATNGFEALNSGGGFLDGLATGIPGSGDYTASFTVNAAASHQDVVWAPATADGPGQPLSAPGNNQAGGGYPLYLSDTSGSVTSVQVTLNYDPALLTVSGVSGAGFTLLAGSTPGEALLQYSGTPLPAGTQTPIGFLLATVPSGTAANPVPYRAKDLLHLSSVVLNGGAIATTAADAFHLVAYVGDADGNGSYSSNDAVLITRTALQSDSGFSAYPLVDPVIVADTGGSGFIPADAALQVNEAGVGFPTANLPSPPIPSGVVFQPISNNVDPSLSLELGAQSSEHSNGGIVTAAVNLDDPDPAGSTGLIEAHLALTYDPRQLSVTAADVHVGSLLAAAPGWVLQTTINAVTGQIAIALSSTIPIRSTLGGSLVIIDFHYAGDASQPPAIALVASVSPTGQEVIRTELEDAQGTFLLSPWAG